MDGNTTLLLYGDHGLTQDGNHGGGTKFETRTVLFGYTKSGFPLQRQTKKIKSLLESHLYEDTKQLDIVSIAANLLEIPVPFSSLGILNPLFLMSESTIEVA